MISHVSIGTNDRDRAISFYSVLMAELGWLRRHSNSNPELAIWQPADAGRPLLLVGTPFDGNAATPGNGGMVAFAVRDRATVDRAFSLSLAAGATSEGPPGLRPHYHAHYYGAYFRDLDGNKLCVVCHEPHAAG